MKMLPIPYRRRLKILNFYHSQKTFTFFPIFLQIQEIAATKLEELRRSEEESLSNQAARASTELELGRSMLESLKEADETVVGSLRNLREQAKYRSELDHCRNLKKVANDERKNRDLEMDRLYKEACEREEVKRRENDAMKRNIGLKIGKCLRVRF